MGTQRLTARLAVSGGVRERQPHDAVMEYVEGGDLWRALQREGSRVRSWAQQGNRVALDIARGLCFLHAHSIV